VLVNERETADFFEAVAKGRDAKAAANWIINELVGRLNKEGRDISASPATAAQPRAVLDLVREGTTSGQIVKDGLAEVLTEGRLRGGLDRRGRSANNRRTARHEAGDRSWSDREGRRRDHREEPGQGGAGESKAGIDRLVRRSGDEVLRRQGEPAGG